jgi:hypothetical protein
MLTIIIPVAIAALVLILGVIAFQRGRESFDLSGPTVLRAYLYLGLFAGIIAIAFGLSALLNGALATAVGNDVIYGAVPGARPCPPNADCSTAVLVAVSPELERRRLEDLVRGVTFSVFGALFYGAHRAALTGGIGGSGWRTFGDHGGLRRAYLLLGTLVFGIAAIALLPAGVYQLLANAVLPRNPGQFVPGVADSLSGGVVSFVFWLIFLRAVLRDARGGSPRFYRAGPSTPPAEPAPVGAPLGPRPGERSTGAEAAIPPRERE